MEANSPLLSSLDAVREVRRSRFNPLKSLTPDSLTRALDNFEQGTLRDAALLWETIADRDDTLKSVKPKREKEVSQLDFQTMPVGKEKGSAYEAHRDVLEDFWNNARCLNAYDRNDKGGFKKLVRQMMSAVSYRYAVHHIHWRPTANGLRATFEFVPLWLFENITGELRYLENPYATEGVMMDKNEWMITASDGLMVACSIGYFAKKMTYNDLLIFSEKFSMPGVLGRTSAAKGSPEGLAMREAVANFGHDWTACLYGDDNTHASPIQLIEANGNPNSMPMPVIIDRIDRKFATLYRGADLSTLSSRDGKGTGASLQADEKDVLMQDDAETINETLAGISEKVIQWHFGHHVEPLAKIELLVPSDEDSAFLLDASCKLSDRSVPISKSSLLDRLAIETATDEADALQPASAPPAPTGMAPELPGQNPALTVEANAKTTPSSEPELTNEEFEQQASDLIGNALRDDMEPVANALQLLANIDSVESRDKALKKLSAQLPQIKTSALETAIHTVNTSAQLNGFTAEPTK